FLPRLRLSSLKQMARVHRQRVGLNFQIVNNTPKRCELSGSKFLAGVVNPEKDAAIVPARERQATIAQPHFARLRRRMQSNGLRGARYNSIQRGAGLREKCLRFAMRDEPSIQVARALRVNLFEN